ncbi:DUF4136 domain-containing protein [Pseudanabaena biceps]|nr:DUF4136 domain-containing protein [Pseudanabaena biceps]
MQLRKAPVLAVAAALTLAGCASTPTAEVTRFHMGQPIATDTIRIVASPDPVAPGTPVSLEFRTHANVVAQDLARHGFRPVEGAPSAYIAILNVQQTTRAGIPSSSPFRIGIGGGTSSGNVGIGGSVNVPVGQPRNNDVRVNVLALRIRRASDSSAVWEGRAVQEVPARQQGSNLSAAVPALSRALFAEFPGESGRVVTVKLQ